MKGRKPKPVAIRVLEGNPGKRALPIVPQPAPGRPETPDWLTQDALDMWNNHVGDLALLGIVTKLDGPAFSVLCTWVAAFKRAVADYEASTGSDRQAAFRRMRDSARELHRWCSEFGLTPVSRTRLAIRAPDDGPDEFAEFLSTV